MSALILILLLGGSLSGDETPLNQIGTTYEQPDYRLTLGGTRFDPLEGLPPNPAGFAPIAINEPDLFLVQFDGPVRGQWLRALRKQDLEPVSYIHPFTYVVWGHQDNLSQVDGNAHVRWTGPFQAGFRLLPGFQNLRSGEIAVRVLVYREANLSVIAEAMVAMGGHEIKSTSLGTSFISYSLSLSADRLTALAVLPGIYTVQPVPTDGGLRAEFSLQYLAGNTVGSDPFPGYLSYINTIGLSGAGVLMANVDAGVNNNHPDLIGRFVSCVGVSCDNTGTAQHAHGSHTAGIMAADGSSGETDANGFLRGLGVAPGAQLIEQTISGNYSGPEGMLLLIRESAENNAVLSSNSWGPTSSALGYNANTMEVDMGVRDAMAGVAGNQGFTYVLAIDNGGAGTSTQGVPDDGKNLFTVGSTWMRLSNGDLNPNVDGVSSNSANGPALDGRLLPLIVAPGHYIDSTVLGTNYGFNFGTSMAAPHVSGAVGLFFEYYRNLTSLRGAVADPSPAMVKAAFIPVALDLFGLNDGGLGLLGHHYDNKQGWGRLNIPAVITPEVEVLYFENPRVLENTDELWRARLEAVDETEPVKMMLAWTDAPGHGLGGSSPAWNNDLDLLVDYDGGSYVGNNLGSDGWSEPGGLADEKNNTEGILLGPTAAGEIVVSVVARNLTSDGIPAVGGGTDQDFALVCYNCRPLGSFSISLPMRKVPVCNQDEVSLSVQVPAVAGFSEMVTLSTVDLPVGVSASFADNPVTPGGQTMLTLSGLLAIPQDTYAVQVHGTSASWSDFESFSMPVLAGPPAAPTLSVPIDEAGDQTLSPLFSWVANPNALSYHFELSTDPGFSTTLHDETLTVNTLTLPISLEHDTVYYWRVSVSNDCGSGTPASAFSFTTQLAPVVLLVDDDDNEPSVLEYYTSTLDFLGVTYQVYDTDNSNLEPGLADLDGFELVIWFSGNAFGGGGAPKAGPATVTEANLATFLDGGGKFLLSSQHYFQDMATGGVPDGFMANYLGLDGANTNQSYGEVIGSGPFLGGLGPFSISPPFTNRCDVLLPDAMAEEVFLASGEGAALLNTNGTFSTLYLGFSFEGLDELDARQSMAAMLSALGVGVAGGCLNEANFLAKLPFWPEDDVRELVTCLNAFQVAAEKQE